MLSRTSAQESSPAKGLGDSSHFQLIYSDLRALLAEQEDWQCIRAPNWKVIKSLSEAGKLRPPANLSACSQLRGTRESNNPLKIVWWYLLEHFVGSRDRSKPARGELFGSELCQMDLGPKGQMMGQNAGDWLCHGGDALAEEVVPVFRAQPWCCHLSAASSALNAQSCQEAERGLGSRERQRGGRQDSVHGMEWRNGPEKAWNWQ